MGKRFCWAIVLATLLASSGCLREVCERHGYFPTAPAAGYPPQCCVPVCATAPAAYAPPVASWNAPTTCPAGCVPAH